MKGHGSGGTMFRLGVVICLSSVVAAGPWVCCCTAARLTANLLAPPAAAPNNKAAAHHSDACPCCRDHDGNEGERLTDRCPVPAHQPGSPDCPCKQPTGTETLVLPSTGKTTSISITLSQALLPVCLDG